MYRQEVEPVARGEFFQFCWLTVGENDFDLAVIDAGNVYPRSFHTVDDEREIVAIENEYVTCSPVHVDSGGDEWIDVTVTVENAVSVAINDAIEWNVPDGWEVEPPTSPVLVEPGGMGEFPFSVRNSGNVYPAPRLVLTYPLSNGMEIETDIPIPVTRSATAARLGARPTIDGVLAEPCWADAAAVTRFYPAYEGYDVDGGTEFRFGYDDEHLYVSVVCYDQLITDLEASAEERDGTVYREDCVGLFLQPDTERMVVYQIYFSTLGTVFDQRIEFDESLIYTADRVWDGEYEAAARVSEDRWVLEAAIPFDALGVSSIDGGLWRVNFRRKQQRTNASADWQVPIDYNPSTFGELIFE
ncbi:hypothetical protein K8S17_01055 [bacterium]|nr:hypothetical protein [bacterium]